MKKEKIERINFLARKAKSVGLTEAEKDEQMALREEYRASFRADLHNTLQNTYIKRPDGTVEKVMRKPDAKC